MGDRKKTATEITLYFTEAEYALLCGRARRWGVSVSTYIRLKCLLAALAFPWGSRADGRRRGK